MNLLAPLTTTYVQRPVRMPRDVCVLQAESNMLARTDFAGQLGPTGPRGAVGSAGKERTFICAHHIAHCHRSQQDRSARRVWRNIAQLTGLGPAGAVGSGGASRSSIAACCCSPVRDGRAPRSRWTCWTGWIPRRCWLCRPRRGGWGGRPQR